MSERDVLYRREGRRYIPVSLIDHEWRAFPNGSHLVVADLPGRTIYRYNVANEDAAVCAALTRCEDFLVSALVKESTVRPARPPITDAQRQAWEHFIEVMGDSGRTVCHVSAQEIAANALKQMNDRVEAILADPRVIEAYQQFKTVVAMIGQPSDEEQQ